MIPGEYGFIAQLNEGLYLKKRSTEFRVDKVLQPFDGNKFNFTKVELLKYPVRSLVFAGGNTLQDLSKAVSDSFICHQDNNIPLNAI